MWISLYSSRPSSSKLGESSSASNLKNKNVILKWNQHHVDFLSWLLVFGRTSIQHELTAASSLSSKILVRMSLRRGTVMIRMKGKASEATVDFTTHRRTIHNNWMMVNMFIRHVFTCMWNKTCLELWQGLAKSIYFAFFYVICIILVYYLAQLSLFHKSPRNGANSSYLFDFFVLKVFNTLLISRIKLDFQI